MDPTTTAKPSTDYYEVGRRAFADGDPCVPILNGEVQAAIADLPVGGGAVTIMGEFQRGWIDANLVNDGT